MIEDFKLKKMGNQLTADSKLRQEFERIEKVLDNLTTKDPSIIRDEVLEKYDIHLKKFYPAMIDYKYEKSTMAFEVVEGKLYDVKIGPYTLMALSYPEERKGYGNMQRYMVLYNSDLIFKHFTDLRAINAKIVFNDNGIWAYKNDSELYSNREMAERMVKKLQVEKENLLDDRVRTMIAFQGACVESNITSEAMEILVRELELPLF